jgi:KAP family P-loop domain
VIADHNVSPPLAIGLFGIWGSGKSTMIRMIDRALADIEVRSNLDDRPRFCRGIVSVTFNAWHYAETNLWASLFVTILKEMSRHLRVNVEPAEQDERDRSLLDLNNAKLDEQRANAEVAEAELLAARAVEKVAKSEQTLAAAQQAEADVTAAQEKARHAALAAESSRFHALDLVGDAAALLFAFGRPTATELSGTAGEELAAILKVQSQEIFEVMESFKGVSGPLGRLQAILGWPKPILIHLILAGAIAIPVALFGWFAFAHHWFEAIAGSALSAIAIAAGAVTTLAPLWARAREALSRAPALLNSLATQPHSCLLRG